MKNIGPTAKMVVIASFLCLLLLTGFTDSKNLFIVGGQNANIEKYPSLVQVEFYFPGESGWDQRCGANILTTYWILSAAHCFSESWYSRFNTRIRAGATYRNTGGSVHYIDFERNHSDYGRLSRYDADISVLRLKTPLVYSPTIQKVTIVPQDFVIQDNSPVVHAGWGRTRASGQTSPVLQDVTIYTVNSDICAQRYGYGTITANMICAGILDVGGKDACQGDSGGPLYGGGVLIGIVSFGNGCAEFYYPGVSTRVASYTNWIIENAR